MTMFAYQALDRHGNKVKGVIDAKDEANVALKLNARNLNPYKISMKRPSKEFQFLRRKISAREQARYIRQLSTLLTAGVTLLDAMQSLAKSNAHPQLSKISAKIRQDLREGKRLSDAIDTHLPEMPHYVARWAELGEATGLAAKSLSDAADRMEYEDTMRSEIKTALSYPLFLACVGSVIILFLFIFVVPKFDAMIGENRDNLPVISSIVIGTGVKLKENLMLFWLSISGLIVLLLAISTTATWKIKLRTLAEKAPLVGPLLLQSDLGNWARTVGVSLDNGASLLAALKQGEHSIRSFRLQARMKDVYIAIKAGGNIDEVLADNIPDFDPLTIDLIRTGSSSGGLSSMLLFIGKMQEDEIRELTKRLSAFTEPVAILIISAVVGAVVISIVLAMTSLYDFAI